QCRCGRRHLIPGRKLHGGLQRKRHYTPSASARAQMSLPQPGSRGYTARSLLQSATRQLAASGTTLAAGAAAACPGRSITAISPAGAGQFNEEIEMPPNVDRAEVAKFEALASRWWDREREFKPLHEINPLRTTGIDDQASLAGKEVLDVGCG